MIRKLLKNMLGNEFTESKEKYAKINFTIIAVMFLISIIMLFFLPEQIPILHQGETTYNVPSILGVWLIPVLGIILNLSFIKQRRLSSFNTIVFVVLGVVMCICYFRWM